MEKKTQNEKDREIIQLTAKLQMSLGEALFRAKFLSSRLSKSPDLGLQFGSNLEKLISTLGELTHLYRHSFADEIESALLNKDRPA
jgi:hypothetical protein